MGTDCKITLPSDVRVSDVAEVIGILAGNKKYWGGSDSAKWVEVENVTTKPCSVVSCADIDIVSDNVIGRDNKFIHATFFFEWENTPDKGMSPPSTPFWCAVAKRLVEFFGGSVDYNDCDGVERDLTAKRPRKRNNPGDGDEWDNFQNELFKIKPLTINEINRARKFASYK